MVNARTNTMGGRLETCRDVKRRQAAAKENEADIATGDDTEEV
jgi:hypothetical protein